jgi:hypothetical protein
VLPKRSESSIAGPKLVCRIVLAVPPRRVADTVSVFETRLNKPGG